MSCCNHDCNQGRECPKRAKHEAPPMVMYAIVSVILAAVILLTWK